MSCYLNSGQTCSAHTRMLVPESRYEEAARIAVEAAKTFTVGDPFGGAAKLGPLISEAQRERVRNYIRKGMAEGAQLLCGGPDAPADLPKGYYVQPTVFGRVDPRSTIAQEEIFGPVLAIIPYHDEEEAVRIANGTPYGLAGGVWAGSDERAQQLAKKAARRSSRYQRRRLQSVRAGRRLQAVRAWPRNGRIRHGGILGIQGAAIPSECPGIDCERSVLSAVFSTTMRHNNAADYRARVAPYFTRFNSSALRRRNS